MCTYTLSLSHPFTSKLTYPRDARGPYRRAYRQKEAGAASAEGPRNDGDGTDAAHAVDFAVGDGADDDDWDGDVDGGEE